MNVSDSSLSPMNVLFDPNATRLEMVPQEVVNQAVEECKRMAREYALLVHPEYDDAIVEITGLERRPGWCHVDVNVRMVPPPKVHINIKITSETKHDQRCIGSQVEEGTRRGPSS